MDTCYHKSVKDSQRTVEKRLPEIVKRGGWERKPHKKLKNLRNTAQNAVLEFFLSVDFSSVHELRCHFLLFFAHQLMTTKFHDMTETYIYKICHHEFLR